MIDPAEWGIPTLDAGMQATRVPDRWVAWGSVARTSNVSGGYHFYASDYKFAGLWRDRERLPSSGCKVAVEVNYSTAADTPRAVALGDICRKRTLAALWQARGVRMVVDLCVHPAFADLALLGVPEGWRAYATRKAATDRRQDLDRDLDTALARAGGPPVLFLVFGGGKLIRDYCRERGWTWVVEPAKAARGLSI